MYVCMSLAFFVCIIFVLFYTIHIYIFTAAAVIWYEVVTYVDWFWTEDAVAAVHFCSIFFFLIYHTVVVIISVTIEVVTYKGRNNIVASQLLTVIRGWWRRGTRQLYSYSGTTIHHMRRTLKIEAVAYARDHFVSACDRFVWCGYRRPLSQTYTYIIRSIDYE